MKLTYMTEPVDIACLLKAHDITMERLQVYIDNCVENKFTIDENEYLINWELKQKRKPKYTCSNGTVKHKGLTMLRASKIIGGKISNVSYHMKGNIRYQFGKWLVERDE